MNATTGLNRGAPEAETGMTCFAPNARTPSGVPRMGRNDMHHRKLFVARVILLAMVAVGSSSPRSLAAVQTLGSEGEIPTDPAVTVGSLPNGLTYYVRANDQPENRAELWLVVDVGSVLEDDDQRGLAHFVEHMAFNGTEHFEKQELVDYLESIGMRFGPSINAFTSFDETVYTLRVPTDDAEVLDTGLQILEDWSQGITFDSEEVDKERGVVIEEWRRGLGASARMRDKQFPILFKGSRYAERLPIGSEQILQTFDQSVLRRYYEDWYRPELMAVIAVGDFEPEAMESLIREHFSRVPPSENPRVRTYFEVPAQTETLLAIATDPEATSTSVAVGYKQPVPEEGTMAAYRDGIVSGLFNSMLNDRLFEITRRPGAPFLGAFSGQGRLVRTSEVYQLGAAVRDGGVLPGLEALLTEGERVARYGFTGSELGRHKTNTLRGMEQAFAERNNRDSRSFAREYQRAFLQGEPIPGIEWEFSMVARVLQAVRLEDVNRLAGEWITDQNRVVLVNAPEKDGGSVPTESEILAVFGRVATADIAPYTDVITTAPLVSETPAPGTILSESTIEEIGVTQWELSNGVRVILKPTDFKDDEIILRAQSPGGSSLAGDDVFESAQLAAMLVGQGGVGEHSLLDLDKVLTGKAVSVRPIISELSEGLVGGASPRDVETMFQLAYLYMTAPRKDLEAFQAFLQRSRPGLANRGASPEANFGDTLAVVMSQGNPRAAPPSVELLDRLDLDVAFEFYGDRFADAGDFTFALVGAFELDDIRRPVLQWLGSLPTRGREEAWRDLGIDPPTGVVRRVVRKGVEPKSNTRIIFTGPFEYTAANRTGLRLLSNVLETRLRDVMREDLGGTYSVTVGGGASKFPDQDYTISVGFGSDPGRMDELVNVVFDEIATLKADGPTEEELATVKEQDRRSLEENRESNSWWASQLIGSDFEDLDPTRLVRNSVLDAVTAEGLRELARRWLNTDNYVQVTLVPSDRLIGD
ncbi:MAG: insulinase family protein [Gemmatimonadota bacterium]|nr:MAG: insulinase family protein [Gemmatimonadota bacterium]